MFQLIVINETLLVHLIGGKSKNKNYQKQVSNSGPKRGITGITGIQEYTEYSEYTEYIVNILKTTFELSKYMQE